MELLYRSGREGKLKVKSMKYKVQSLKFKVNSLRIVYRINDGGEYSIDLDYPAHYEDIIGSFDNLS